MRGPETIAISGDPLLAGLALARSGLVATIAHEHFDHFDAVPNDPGYASQWPLAAVNAPTAWNYTHGSANVVVADVDSGVDATHPDLVNKLVPGWDATGNVPLPPGNSDVNGHGTAVAGVIGAETNNGAGLASVGWDTKVMPIRAVNPDGTVPSSAVAGGIRWATDHGARIINLSLGSACNDQLTSAAVAYAQAHNILVVASAGNDALTGDHVEYPAALPGVIAVAATGATGVVARYSNFGTYVSIAAPGGSSDGNPADDVPVLAIGGGTTTQAGTSFAAPMVAAAAALVLAVRPNLPAQSVADVLSATATPRGAATDYGAGLLNVAAALQATTGPAAPTGVMALMTGFGRAVVSWTPAPANGSPITGYTVTAAPGGATIAASGTQTTVTFSALDVSTTYTFTVTATNAFGTGPPSAPSNAIAPMPPRQTPTRFASGVGLPVAIKATPSSRGLLILGRDGTIAAFGDGKALGNARLPHPVVTLTVTPSGNGYRAFDTNGCAAYFGDASRFVQDVCALPLNGPVLDAATRPQGDGYWLVASDGGMFSFGGAPFFGSMGGQQLNGPVVGMAPAPDGSGYWEVASDGGIFSFGVPFLGSMGDQHLNKPVVGMVASGTGYMMVASDGGVFNFGNPFFGSLGGSPIAQPIVSIAPSYDNGGHPNGYWMLDATGSVYAFGSAWSP